MSYRIVPATLRHCLAVARDLRPLDRAEIVASGREPRELLRFLWANSTAPWAAYIDDDIALVGGCASPLMRSTGRPWLFTTPAIERAPLAFAKESRAWLMKELATRQRLVTNCLSTYEKSLRFWTMLGFRVGETVDLNGAKFQELVMER